MGDGGGWKGFKRGSSSSNSLQVSPSMYHFSGHARGRDPQHCLLFHSSCLRRLVAKVLGQKMRLGRGVMPRLLFLQSDGWEDRKPSKYIILLNRKITQKTKKTYKRSPTKGTLQHCHGFPGWRYIPLLLLLLLQRPDALKGPFVGLLLSVFGIISDICLVKTEP